MFKSCLLVLAFYNAVFATDESNKPLVLNMSKGTADKVPVITLNGQQNYNAVQQIFYFSDQQREAAERQVPDDYVATPDVAAHKLNPRLLTWNRARKACIEEGGYLAVINSLREEKLMLKMLNDSGKSSAWLGVHDQFEEGDWVTVKDEALESTGYSKWTTKFSNQPSNYGGNQNCALLLKEGGMNDETCNFTRPSFCKIDL
ncbi:hypothetical protein KM043_009440 [Ampulex compressa]|nr:hypothetical protein KM043_009440 [Ampulex compressa]